MSYFYSSFSGIVCCLYVFDHVLFRRICHPPVVSRVFFKSDFARPFPHSLAFLSEVENRGGTFVASSRAAEGWFIQNQVFLQCLIRPSTNGGVTTCCITVSFRLCVRWTPTHTGNGFPRFTLFPPISREGGQRGQHLWIGIPLARCHLWKQCRHMVAAGRGRCGPHWWRCDVRCGQAVFSFLFQGRFLFQFHFWQAVV